MLSLLSLVGCAEMGFKPALDAQIALAQAVRPDPNDEFLYKQDPRAALWLDDDPAVIDGYDVLNIRLSSEGSHAFLAEQRDRRLTFEQYAVKKVSRSNGQWYFEFECRDPQDPCQDAKSGKTDFSKVQTNVVAHERKVWRAAVYNPQTRKIEGYYNAVYRPQLHTLRVLFPLDVRPKILGKRLYILSAYGGFLIDIGGEFIPLPNCTVGTLPQSIVDAHPSIITSAELETMDRTTDGGRYFLDVIASEFSVPAPFHSGAADPMIYAGATQLTREVYRADRYLRRGSGGIGYAPHPLMILGGVAMGALLSSPQWFPSDCGNKQSASK